MTLFPEKPIFDKAPPFPQCDRTIADTFYLVQEWFDASGEKWVVCTFTGLLRFAAGAVAAVVSSIAWGVLELVHKQDWADVAKRGFAKSVQHAAVGLLEIFEIKHLVQNYLFNHGVQVNLLETPCMIQGNGGDRLFGVPTIGQVIYQALKRREACEGSGGEAPPPYEEDPRVPLPKDPPSYAFSL